MAVIGSGVGELVTAPAASGSDQAVGNAPAESVLIRPQLVPLRC